MPPRRRKRSLSRKHRAHRRRATLRHPAPRPADVADSPRSDTALAPRIQPWEALTRHHSREKLHHASPSHHPPRGYIRSAAPPPAHDDHTPLPLAGAAPPLPAAATPHKIEISPAWPVPSRHVTKISFVCLPCCLSPAPSLGSRLAPARLPGTFSATLLCSSNPGRGFTDCAFLLNPVAATAPTSQPSPCIPFPAQVEC